LREVVVDASVALAWCFPDETNEYADAVLVALEGWQVSVPAVWPLEITNAVVVGQRRKRITQPEVRRFVELLEGLNIRQEALPVAASVSNVVPLALEYDLSAYDASYLEVAIRRGARLATLDTRLERAGKKAGVELLLSGRRRK
jgi:predicted nucleic acid-binding protein